MKYTLKLYDTSSRPRRLVLSSDFKDEHDAAIAYDLLLHQGPAFKVEVHFTSTSVTNLTRNFARRYGPTVPTYLVQPPA